MLPSHVIVTVEKVECLVGIVAVVVVILTSDVDVVVVKVAVERAIEVLVCIGDEVVFGVVVAFVVVVVVIVEIT